MMRVPGIKEKHLGVLAGLLLLFLVFVMDLLGFFVGPNQYFYDLFFRIRGPRNPGSRIVIAAIDESTLKRFGKWPIDRRHYAELLDRTSTAQVVAMDIILSEPSKDDSVLAEAIARHGRVILPMYIDPQGEIISPEPSLKGHSSGHIHVEQGIDGVTREVYHTLCCHGRMIPSFSSALYEAATGNAYVRSKIPDSGCAATESTCIIQTDPMLINYYGPRGTFKHISVADILDGQGLGPDFFAGKIVLVGLTASGIDGTTLTPFMEMRNQMSGVETHAHILDNLLETSFIFPLRDDVFWLAVLFLITVSLLFFPRLSAGRLVLVWFSSMLAVGVILLEFFAYLNLSIPAAPLFLAVTAAAGVSYIFKLHGTQNSLVLAQRDWEESFNTIEDAIMIHNERCEIVKANRTASECLSPFICEQLRQRCNELKELHVSAQTRSSRQGGPSGEFRPAKEVFDEESDRHYEMRSLPRSPEAKRFSGAVQVVRDITKGKQYEKEQRELQAMLIQAQKVEAIGMLAGGIAHDFNNILASIMGYTELVYYQIPDDSPLRHKLAQVLKASWRARDVIAQILSFTRRAAQEKKTLEAALVVKEALKLIRITLPATIEIRVDIQSDGLVEGDPTQIHQILLNLCTNAYHAMREKGGVLTVSLDEVSLGAPLERNGQVLQPGAYLKLIVSDTGHGIPPELRNCIFDPFFTNKPQGEGTGLGLTTVRGIAEEYGGMVTFESEMGKGTVFHVYLPRKEAPSALDDGMQDEYPAKGQGRILFVDDEVELAALAQEMITSLGYQVTQSSSPVEALELFRANPLGFDLMITDMTMPKLTGEELAVKIREIRPDLPIILCTGFSDKAGVDRAYALGLSKVIMKPFDMKGLADSILSLLQQERDAVGT